MILPVPQREHHTSPLQKQLVKAIHGYNLYFHLESYKPINKKKSELLNVKAASTYSYH
jgi:hypothetical protein